MRRLASSSLALLTATFLASTAPAQTVTEIPTMTVAHTVIDMDNIPGAAGPVTVAAINNAGAPTPGNIKNVTLNPNPLAAAGIYNTNAGNGRAIGLLAGQMVTVDPPSGSFDAFNASIDLGQPSTEFGIEIGDWNGPGIIDFYQGPTLVTSHTTATAWGAGITVVLQMTGATFDRVDVQVSTTTGNWVITELHIENGGTPTSPKGIILNEFDTGAVDFVEILNTNTFQADISGFVVASWTASSAAPATLVPESAFTLPPGTLVGPKSFLVLQELGTAGAPGSLPGSIHTGFDYVWNATTTIELALYDATAQGGDYVIYDHFGAISGAGPNLPAPTTWTGDFDAGTGNNHARNKATDTNNATDWAKTANAHTAGAYNPGQLGAQGVLINEVYTLFDYVELWNSTANPIDVSGYAVNTWASTGTAIPTTTGSYILPAGTVIPGNGFLVLQESGTAGATGTLPNSIQIGFNWPWVALSNVEVMLADLAGQPVDYVWADNNNVGPTGNLLKPENWVGTLVAPGTANGDTISRVSVVDRNNAGDWIREDYSATTEGALNALQNPACAGFHAQYGTGCKSALGNPVLFGTGCPTPGGSITIEVAFGPSKTTGMIVLGLGTASIPVTPCCALQTNPVVPPQVGFPMLTTNLSLPAKIPAGIPTPVDLYVQFLFADTMNPCGVSGTNPLQLHFQ